MDRGGGQQQHRRGYSMGSGVREKDEDLALFQDMRKRERTHYLYPSTDDQVIEASLSTKFGGLSHPNTAPPAARKGVGADLLNSDADKNDYDWLLTPPGTPLFPSLDLDSPAYAALQQGVLINRNLSSIKTSRATTNRVDPPAKVARGNPSPTRRPSTPQNGPSSNGRSRSLPAATASHINVRPATPTGSSTSNTRASASTARPATPTRQNSTSAGGRPLTPTGTRPPTPTARPATPTNKISTPSNRPATPTSGRPSTPTLRRSSSSPTSGRPYSAGSNRGNPSPTRSTASSASTRGVSPVRGNSRGTSPARGTSPISARGQSSSPRAYPVAASDDIPPNLRTTSDRPSSAQRRAADGAGAGQSPDGGENPRRQTISPRLNHSYISPSQNLDRSSRASSDSESSFDASSQSGVSSRGLTPERSGYGRRMSTGNDDIGRPTLKTKRSHSSHFGPSLSKKSLDSAARDMQRGSTSAFRPLMTNSSISTFYSSRASTLLRRPLTPSSTASSEQGASVTPDSEGEEEVVNKWGLLDPAAAGHSPQILVLDKEAENSTSKMQENGLLISQDINVGDNEEVSSRRRMEPTEAELKERPLFMRADEVHHFKNFENSGSGRTDFDNVRDRVESSSTRGGESYPSPMIDHQNRDFQRGISGDVVFQEPRNDSPKPINAGWLSNKPERSQCEPDAHHLGNPGDKSFTPDRSGSLDSTGSREPGLGSSIGATPDPSGVVLNDGGGGLTSKEDLRTSFQEQGQSLSGLERVRDKLRHLQNPSELHNVDAAEKQDAGETVSSNSNFKAASQEPDEVISVVQEAGLEQRVIVNLEDEKVCKCSHMEHPGETCKEPACSCGMSETSAPKMVTQKQKLVETPRGSEGMESVKPNIGLSKGLDWAREKDIWYIYRHSSDYEVPVVGFAHTKVEIPLQTLAKEDHSRGTEVSKLKAAVGIQEDQTFTTEAPRQQEFDGHSFKVENPIKTVGEEHTNAVEQQKALQKEQEDFQPSDKPKVEDYTVTGKSVGSLTPKVEALSQQACELTGAAGKMNALQVKENLENHNLASSCQQAKSTNGADSMITGARLSPTLGSKSNEKCEKLDAKCPGDEEELKQGSESFLGAREEVQALGQSSDAVLPLSENWVDDSRSVDVSTAGNIFGEAVDELSRGAQWDPEMQKAIYWEKERLTGLESQQQNQPEVASTLVSNKTTSQIQLPKEVSRSTLNGRKQVEETDYEAPNSNLTANVALVSDHVKNHDLLALQGPFQDNPQTSAVFEANSQLPEVLVPTARVRDADPISAKIESNGSRSLGKMRHEDQELTARGVERQSSQNDEVAGTNLHEYMLEEEVFIDIPVDLCGGASKHTAATSCKQPKVMKSSPDLNEMIEISQSSPKPLDLKNGRTLQELQTCETDKQLVVDLAGSPKGNLGTRYTLHADSKELRQVDHGEQDRLCSQSSDKNEISLVTPLHTTAHHCWDEFKNPDVESHAMTRVLHAEKPSMCSKGFEASFGGGLARKNGNGLQNSFSQSNSSNSSAQTPTSGSSIDLSRSTDTMSSCPSNASWEDPHYVLHPRFWNSKSSPETVQVPDVSATAPLPVKLCAVEIPDKGLVTTSADDVAYANGGLQRSSHVKDGSFNRDNKELDTGEELFDYDFDYLGAKKEKVPQTMEAPIIAKMVVPPTVVEEKQRRGIKGPKASTNVKGASLRDIDGHVIVEKAVELKGVKPPKFETERVATRNSPRDIELPDVRKTSNPKVVQSPVKEEIVENSESPGPNARKHLSSFKFGRKKTLTELERDSTPMGTPNHSQQVSASGKLLSQTAKPAVVPQLTKGRSMGAASPARPVKSADSRPAQAATWGADSKMPEELSIQSRFSNITVRSGSVSENFDWGRSSLEEASSRSGSSSGAVTAPVAVPRSMTLAEATDRILFCSRIVHDIVYRAAELAGDQQNEAREPATFSSQQRTPKEATSSLHENDTQREAITSFPLTTPSNSAYEVLKLSEPDCRNPMEAHTLEPGGWTGLDQKYNPETGIAVTARRTLNYLPKESLDKLGEKLERLEKFGSQALRSPKAHFMSPRQEARSDKEEPSMHPAETVRLRTGQEGLEDLNKNKCRCTIL